MPCLGEAGFVISISVRTKCGPEQKWAWRVCYKHSILCAPDRIRTCELCLRRGEIFRKGCRDAVRLWANSPEKIGLGAAGEGGMLGSLDVMRAHRV